ncbi:MAG TPA: hypothetical protein EYN99_09215 [Gemmatimonadetes bacterium]|jgi:hypothetical protein|nr:hypothetical protein [Gemmatimonadota bacterium]
MKEGDSDRQALLMQKLSEAGPMVAVELRPPRAKLEGEDGMEAWIDLHHSLNRLTSEELFVFLTDNAVGEAEEENLAHVAANLGDEADLRRIVPILTAKHSLEYCRMFASRAVAGGFDALTVLGGDRSVGPERCVPHGRDLRELIRVGLPELVLGGWANPHRDPVEQVGFIDAPNAHADFVLTQIVSHHALAQVERFLRVMDATGQGVPTIFGVFFYRSANPSTLKQLNNFFPVPAEELSRDFQAGITAEEICAQSIREIRRVGADKVYVSNLGNRGAGRLLRRILELV